MGKHEPMTAKAIANKIKAKGLQKIKYYCEMCKKQCRDDNGFKCHITSEAHQRQALIVCEDPEKFVSEFSKQFMDGFMYILRARYRQKRVLANTVFQEYIKERDHIHMNGTRWTSLSEFAKWLGENGHVTVDDSERGLMITYIDRDPETLRRQEIEARRAQQAKEAALKSQKEIERQMKATRELYKKMEKDRPEAVPVPMMRVSIESQKTDPPSDFEEVQPNSNSYNDPASTSTATKKSCDNPTKADNCNDATQGSSLIERPVFKVQTISLKTSSSSCYKPPPPKRKVSSKNCSLKKKSKNN